MSPIHVACSKGDLDAVQRIVEADSEAVHDNTFDRCN